MLNTIRIIRDINVEKESPWNVIEEMIIDFLKEYGSFSAEDSLLLLGFDVYEKLHSECVNVLQDTLELGRFLFFRNVPVVKSYHPKFTGKIVFYTTVIELMEDGVVKRVCS